MYVTMSGNWVLRILVRCRWIRNRTVQADPAAIGEVFVKRAKTDCIRRGDLWGRRAFRDALAGEVG
jgi:hypothetical protein